VASRELKDGIKDLEEAVAWLALGKKQRSNIPPPRFLVLYGYTDAPSRNTRSEES